MNVVFHKCFASYEHAYPSYRKEDQQLLEVVSFHNLPSVLIKAFGQVHYCCSSVAFMPTCDQSAMRQEINVGFHVYALRGVIIIEMSLIQ